MILAINAGSSTVKFAAFDSSGDLRRIAGATLTRGDEAAADHVARLEAAVPFATVAAVGHRVVLSARRPATERVSAALLADLASHAACDVEHFPAQLELIEAIAARHPALPQFTCSDSAFHDTMPRVARILPIPRRFDEAGIQRYGFHGLSCTFLMEELRRLDPAAAARRVILAHLGHGASITAVLGGRSVDTTMGFTPDGGLVMGTRTGDLDPGVLLAMLPGKTIAADALSRLVNHDSGLRGISASSGDMRELMERAGRDVRAAEAIDVFCHQGAKWIGAMAAVLGGVDSVVFAGGIGENVPAIRERICRNLEFLGVRLDAAANDAGATVISTGRVAVRVIRTNEEIVIARAVRDALADRTTR